MELEPSDEDEIYDLFGKHTVTPIERTNILPLRWFGNFCNIYPASFAMNKALWHEDYADYHNKDDISRRGKLWWRLYTFLNTPYDKWGTTYKVEWQDKED